MLWERTPSEIKEVNFFCPVRLHLSFTQTYSELGGLWEIGKKLWKHEFSEVYKIARKYSWSDAVRPLVSALIGESFYFM